MSFSPVFSYRPHIGWRKTLQPLARVTVSDEEDTHQCLHDFSHLICLTPSTNPSSKGQQQHQQQQQQKSWNIKKRKKKEGTAWLGTPPPLAIFPQHSNPFKSIQINDNQFHFISEDQSSPLNGPWLSSVARKREKEKKEAQELHPKQFQTANRLKTKMKVNKSQSTIDG